MKWAIFALFVWWMLFSCADPGDVAVPSRIEEKPAK